MGHYRILTWKTACGCEDATNSKPIFIHQTVEISKGSIHLAGPNPSNDHRIRKNYQCFKH